MHVIETCHYSFAFHELSKSPESHFPSAKKENIYFMFCVDGLLRKESSLKNSMKCFLVFLSWICHIPYTFHQYDLHLTLTD